MTIGKAWARVASFMVGNSDGRHCHWCEHVKHEDGCSYCTNPASKFNDGDRIRCLEGEVCAAECGVFKLDAHYEDDANIRRSFTAAAASWLKE
mgnify:CR=1 FL=1